MALDPYAGPVNGIEPLTGDELRREVAYYKRVADRRGEPHDPVWDQWLEADAPVQAGRT